MRIDLAQLKFIDLDLRAMAIDVEEHFGIDLTITSLYRHGDLGVHGSLPLRGLDFRCRYSILGDIIVEYINSKWIYDPERPDMDCCICHDTGSGLHLHLQTHPNTMRI